MGLIDYCQGKETFLILVKDSDTCDVVEKWVSRCIESDLRIRKAKTPGHRVIETSSVMFANYIRTHFPGCKIHIKSIKP